MRTDSFSADDDTKSCNIHGLELGVCCPITRSIDACGHAGRGFGLYVVHDATT